LVVLALVIGLAAGGSAAAVTLTGGGDAVNPVRSFVATVSAGPVEQSVNATGTVEPADLADLSFPVSGSVTEVRVSVGQTVTKGQILARLDSTAPARAVDMAKAARDSAAAQLDSAETAAAAANAPDTAAATVESARAALAAAADKLTSARNDLASTVLTSPIAGTVATVNLAVGDRVGGGGSTGAAARGSSSSGGSTAQIEVVGTKNWTVSAAVSGTDLNSVTKGLQARFTATGASSPVFGLVDSVGVVASTSSGGSATFPVTIKITGTPPDLHPGETGTVVIVVKSLQNVLTVPTAALRQENGQTVVTKVVGGRDVTAPVVVGTSYGASTEVTSGLSDGDQVRITFSAPTNRSGTQRGGNQNGLRGDFGGGFFGGGFGCGVFGGQGGARIGAVHCLYGGG